jgi:uncharacterized OB-fold protein
MLPLPDRDSTPYWQALAQGVLALQHCEACGHWTWPARPICSGCQSDRLRWEPVSGKGSVASWVIVHRAMTPDLAALVPYPIVLVRIDEQPDILIPGRLVCGSEPRQGLRVRAVAEPVADNIGSLAWTADE